MGKSWRISAALRGVAGTFSDANIIAPDFLYMPDRILNWYWECAHAHSQYQFNIRSGIYRKSGAMMLASENVPATARSAAEIRQDFPILARQVHGKQLVYLDSTASSQKPLSVIETMTEYYHMYNANVHRGVYEISEEATARMEKARVKVARFINARHSKQIIFTRNTSESINLVAYAWGSANIHSGDMIVLTEMEHHSNLVPWQLLAQRTGARLEFIPVTDDGLLDQSAYADLLAQKPKLIAFT